MPVRPAIIPAIRYANAPAAIDFLCAAFGFERQLIVPDPSDAGRILHGQLVWNGQVIMLGSVRPQTGAEPFTYAEPRAAGGVTIALCVIVDDPDAHAARAVAAGATILEQPYDNPGFPGRAYTAADPDGHVWHFSSFDPWSAAA